MNEQQSAERARTQAILRQAIADGLLPQGLVVDGKATPTQIVGSALAGTCFYSGVYAPGGQEPTTAVMLDIHSDDLTWSVMLEDIEDRVLEMAPGRTRNLLERLVALRAAIAPQQEADNG